MKTRLLSSRILGKWPVLVEMEKLGIKGKETTPYLLAKIKDIEFKKHQEESN